MVQNIPATNIIMQTTVPEHAWVAEATAKIGDWRAIIRSVYLRWAITINACCLAEDHYKKLPADKALTVTSLRFASGALQTVELARWKSSEAAAQYAITTPTLSSHAIVELYAALEDTIFELYEIVLRHKPKQLLKGDDGKELRQLLRNRCESAATEAAWQVAWSQRFEKWQRKKLYDGLAKVFLALFQAAGLRRPSTYTLTDEHTWAKNIEMIAELRNHIVHGAPVV